MSQTKQNQPRNDRDEPRADKREFDRTQPNRTDSRQAEMGGKQSSSTPRGGHGSPGSPSADREPGRSASAGKPDVDRRGVADNEDTDQPQGIDEAVAEGVNNTTKQQADGRPQTPDKANKAY